MREVEVLKKIKEIIDEYEENEVKEVEHINEIYDEIDEMYNEIWEDFQRKFVRKFKELLNKYNISLEVKEIEIEIENKKYIINEYWIKSERNRVNLRDKDCENIKYRLTDLEDILNILLNREQIFEKVKERIFMEYEGLIDSVRNLYKRYKGEDEEEEEDC